MSRCDWCIGFIRRDCKIMQRCVKTGRSRASAMSARKGQDRETGLKAKPASAVPNGETPR